MQILLGAAVQKVELVGGESWLSQNLGSFVLAVAAFLAAYVALRNHQQQLRHDRSLRNRDYVRETIDASAAAASEMRIAVDNFLAAVHTVESRRDQNPPGSAEAVVRTGEEMKTKIIEHMFTMREMKARLEIRLENTDPVVTAYGKLRTAINSLYSEAAPGLEENREQDLRDSDEDRTERTQRATGAFLAACREWFNEAPLRDRISKQ